MRVNGRISPTACRHIVPGTVFFCEVPVVSTGSHSVFAMACAKKWSSMQGVCFPCTFNNIASLPQVKLLDHIFEPSNVLAKSLATSLKVECPPPYLFTGLQIFEKYEPGGPDFNSSMVSVSEFVFLVATRSIEKGEPIVYTDNLELKSEMERKIVTNTYFRSINSMFDEKSSFSFDLEDVMKSAFDKMDSIKKLPFPSEEEVALMQRSIEKFAVDKDLGISGFKEEADRLIRSAHVKADEPIDFSRMEEEYERLVHESGL